MVELLIIKNLHLSLVNISALIPQKITQTKIYLL